MREGHSPRVAFAEAANLKQLVLEPPYSQTTYSFAQMQASPLDALSGLAEIRGVGVGELADQIRKNVLSILS